MKCTERGARGTFFGGIPAVSPAGGHGGAYSLVGFGDFTVEGNHMRRVLGGILVVLGALFVGFGFLAKPYIFNSLAIVPLDQDSTSVSQGENMAVLWPHVVDGKGTIDKLVGVKVISTRTVVGIPGVVKDAGLEDTDAFWQTTVKSQADNNGQLVDLTYSNEGVSLDRRTGESTNCCGDFVSTGNLDDPSSQEPIQHEGLVFKFPFGVEKKSYDWWDGDLKRAEPIEFQSEEELFGTKVYVFKQTIAPEALGSAPAPANLFQDGATGNVTATQMYGNTRTLWVEPVTGVLIKGEEQVSKVLEAPGYSPVPRTVGTIGFDEDTVKKNAEDWGAKASLLSFIDTWLTLIGLALGVLLVLVGAWLILWKRPADPAPAERVNLEKDGRSTQRV